MIERDRASSRAIPAAAFVVAVAAAFARAHGGDGGEPDVPALMKKLSTGFSALEKDVPAADVASIAHDVETLRELAPRLSKLKPEIHPELADEFARHVERFPALIDEIGDHSSNGRLSGAAQALDELRATCVSCHVKFRSDNAKRGSHPASANTIIGSIRVFGADGVERSDRSCVLAFLEAGANAAPYVWQRGTAKLSQRLRQFEPRVLPVIVGTRVEFPNDDTIFHNVFSLSKTAPFDLGIYEPGQTASVLMKRTGLVKVYCNIHPDMSASIVVLANPWYALTDRGGGFVICNVPDGDYVLRAWNDHGAEARQPVHVDDSSGGFVSSAQLELHETLHVVGHDNKFGKPYSGKY
jgi:plastocyanin/cytochrome c556